jgi:hypothetical protein
MQIAILFGRAAVEAARILSLPLAVSPTAGDPARMLRMPSDATDIERMAVLRCDVGDDARVSCVVTPAAMRDLPPPSVALAAALASYSDAVVASWATPGGWCDWFLGCCSDDPYPEDCFATVADRVAAYERATLGRWLVARDRMRDAAAWIFRGPAPDDQMRSNIGRWIVRRRNGCWWADGLLPIGQHATTEEAAQAARMVFGIPASKLQRGVPPECR